RPLGVLQRIALVYGASAAIYLTCGWRTTAAIIFAILLLYWPLCLLPPLDGLTADIWVKGHNFVASFDRAVLGGHAYVKGPDGYDPEGILSTLPAIAQGLIGVLAGQYLYIHRGRKAGGQLMITGVILAAAGIGWGFVFPVVKDIWSSSYVLLSSGLTMAALGLLHLWLDQGEPKRNFAVDIALAFGLNAIAAYVYHDLASIITTGEAFKLPYVLAKPWISGPAAELIPVFLFVAIIWWPLDYMRRRGWIVKV
ncbi:MAG: acyltransferase family protein, partial [Asticcacaulis sp.]